MISFASPTNSSPHNWTSPVCFQQDWSRAIVSRRQASAGKLLQPSKVACLLHHSLLCMVVSGIRTIFFSRGFRVAASYLIADLVGGEGDQWAETMWRQGQRRAEGPRAEEGHLRPVTHWLTSPQASLHACSGSHCKLWKSEIWSMSF